MKINPRLMAWIFLSISMSVDQLQESAQPMAALAVLLSHMTQHLESLATSIEAERSSEIELLDMGRLDQN
jgi:hypothetical protein